MATETMRPVLKDKRALVVGIANEYSIAYGCASAFRELGAELAITYLNEKAKAYVEPLAKKLEAPILMPLDVSKPGELEAVFERIGKHWGSLDIVVHSIAWAPKDGGSLFAMSYHGAQKVVANYNVMGPIKAALEAACRYLAYELGPKGIRVHAVSPGPLQSRAASGLQDFDLMLNEAMERAPLGDLVDIVDVGFACAYLATPYARRLTGTTMYVDGGVNIMA